MIVFVAAHCRPSAQTFTEINPALGLEHEENLMCPLKPLDFLLLRVC